MKFCNNQKSEKVKTRLNTLGYTPEKIRHEVNTLDEIEEMICGIRNTIKTINDSESLKAQERNAAVLLEKLYCTESQDKRLILADIFYLLAEIRFNRAEVSATDQLAFYNDAAMRLQYTIKIIKSNNLNKENSNNDVSDLKNARKYLKDSQEMLKNIHQKIVEADPKPIQNLATDSKDTKLGSEDEKIDLGSDAKGRNIDGDGRDTKPSQDEMHWIPGAGSKSISGATDNIDEQQEEQKKKEDDLDLLISEDRFAYKGVLQELRDEMHVVASQPLSIIDARKYCTEIKEQFKEYLTLLFRDAERVIGNPPCSYAVIGLGSMVLQQTTPYSDLEFAILLSSVENANDKESDIQKYFKKLSHYVNFKVIMLGETSIPMSDYGLDLDALIKPGVQFDLGGKTPLGREDQGYNLIQTVDGMLGFLEVDRNGDKFLSYILQSSCFIYGERNLADTYREKVREFLLGSTNSISRAIQVLDTKSSQFGLKGHLEALDFHPFEDSGKIFDVKNEIYRLADRFIYNLGLICKVHIGEGGTWEVIDNLYYQNKLSRHAAENLKKALSFATILRIKIYDFYGHQSERMDTREVINNDSSSHIFHLTTELSDKLFEYYYIIFPLMERLNDFTEKFKENNNNLEIMAGRFFLNDTSISTEVFFKNDLYTEGRIFLRLLKYYKALECFQEIFMVTDALEDAKELTAANSSDGTANPTKVEQIRSEISNKQKSAFLYDDVGVTCYSLKKLEDAKVFFTKSFDIRNSTIVSSKEGHSLMSKSLNNLGLVQFRLKEHDKAINKFLDAYINHNSIEGLYNIGTSYYILAKQSFWERDFKDKLLKSSLCFNIFNIDNDSKLGQANYLISTGMISYLEHKYYGGISFKSLINRTSKLDKSKINNALKKHQEALEVLYEIYSCHPILASTLKQIGQMHHQLKDYKTSLQHEREAAIILRGIYEPNHSKVKNTEAKIEKMKKDITTQKFFDFCSKAASCSSLSKVTHDHTPDEEKVLMSEYPECYATREIEKINAEVHDARNKYGNKIPYPEHIRLLKITMHLLEVVLKDYPELLFLDITYKSSELIENLGESVKNAVAIYDNVVNSNTYPRILLEFAMIIKKFSIIVKKGSKVKHDDQKNKDIETAAKITETLEKLGELKDFAEKLNHSIGQNIKREESKIANDIKIIQSENSESIGYQEISTLDDCNNGDTQNSQAIEMSDIKCTSSNISSKCDEEKKTKIDTKTLADKALEIRNIADRILKQEVGIIFHANEAEYKSKDKAEDNSTCIASLKQNTISGVKYVEEKLEKITSISESNRLQNILNEEHSCKTWLFGDQQINYVIAQEYENKILNHPRLLMIANKLGGIEAVNKLIDLGRDQYLSDAIIEGVREYGAENVINLFFQSKVTTKCLVDVQEEFISDKTTIEHAELINLGEDVVADIYF